MFRNWKLSVIGLATLLGIGAFVHTPTAAARPPFIFVGGGFYGGPVFYAPGPYWYGPWGGPVAYYSTAPHSGKVKIETKMKDASVYVDGGFAGVVHDLHNFNLTPGTHDIELRGKDGQVLHQEHINVIAGKTVTITA